MKNMIKGRVKLIPPIMFRLYQTIRFNRPVDKEKDYISPGGYEFKMRDKDGTEKTVSFDFEYYEGGVSQDNPCIVECMQKYPDFAEYPDLNTVTEHMLRNITEVVEWYIYTGEPGETKDPLIPVKIYAAIEIISDSTERDIPIRRIPINVPIPCGE